MTDCRVNRETNEFYAQIDKDEAKMADNEQAEQERIDSRTDLIMGGDDPDLLAEVLAENPLCVKMLENLCACNDGGGFDHMNIRQMRELVVNAQNLIRSIETYVKNGVAEGHY